MMDAPRSVAMSPTATASLEKPRCCTSTGGVALSARNLEPKEIEEGLTVDAYARVSRVCVSGVERAGALNHRGLRKRCHSGLSRNPAESAERNSRSRDGHPPFGACSRAYLRCELMNRVTGRANRPAKVEPFLGDNSLRSADDAPAREQRQTACLKRALEPGGRRRAYDRDRCRQNGELVRCESRHARFGGRAQLAAEPPE